jgi:hypothetical protein
VTTLYFEVENEDDLRKVGYSKERSIDPQIVVGLLVDRTGFPMEMGCFEGNTAETTTLVPIITAFASRHDLIDTPMVIAADAGTLSASTLSALAVTFSPTVRSSTPSHPTRQVHRQRRRPPRRRTDLEPRRASTGLTSHLGALGQARAA